MQTLRLILTDKFIWLLSGAVLLATLLPVQGLAKDIAGILFNAGIFAVFLLHGIRLERHEVKAGLGNIRLQGTIFGNQLLCHRQGQCCRLCRRQRLH